MITQFKFSSSKKYMLLMYNEQRPRQLDKEI